MYIFLLMIATLAKFYFQNITGKSSPQKSGIQVQRPTNIFNKSEITHESYINTCMSDLQAILPILASLIIVGHRLFVVRARVMGTPIAFFRALSWACSRLEYYMYNTKVKQHTIQTYN